LKNIIFFGPPGAGKGTQAKIISNLLDVPHLSTGDILRSKINQHDELADKLKEILASGKLVSDDILNEIVFDKILNHCKDGFILDGYPRTLNQSNFLDSFLKENSIKINYIFDIEIPFEDLKKRIINRSKEENRDDDNLDVIQTRYNEYLKTTKGVSEEYRISNTKIFYTISGLDQIDEITDKIKKILEI